ncbi:MAG: tetratricopeptide repeat protein [Erythrobacter sp.]
MRKIVTLGAALLLVSCSGQEGPSSNSAITGDASFLELIDDARLAVANGNLPEAGQYYDQAREIEPENPGLWVDIARLRFRGGEHLTAIEAADYALELNPNYAPALLMRAQLVRDANGLSESLIWFEAAAIADPRNPEVLADYAATLGDLGRYQDMLSVVRQLADFAPTYPQVHYLQAVLAARAEDPVLASTLLIRSGLVNNGVPSALMLDAIVDLQQGAFDTAAETLEQLAARQPDNVRVNELYALSLWLGGRDRVIVDQFGQLAQSDDASPYLMMLVGRSLERMGQRERAIPFILKAREARGRERIVLDSDAPNGVPLPPSTAQLRRLVEGENLSRARRAADQLIEELPQSGDIYALAGDTQLASGNAQAALERYSVAAQVRRSWPLTRKIIDAYREYGDELAAEVLLTRYIAGDPQNTDALLLLAESSAEREDWLRVAVLLDTAIGLGAGNDLAVLSLRAQAAEGLEREEEAARFNQLRLELAPDAFIAS